MKTACLEPLVWQLLASIPAGKVVTYGQIARLCGYPGQARLVGRILSQLPEGTKLPWHRVLNARGCSSFPVASDRYRLQLELLQGEGLTLVAGKVNLANAGWSKAQAGFPAQTL